MDIKWEITLDDIRKVETICQTSMNSQFVQNRIKKNLLQTKISITKDEFFKKMIACLLSTQQRSGPESALTKFIQTEPFPLNYQLTVKQKDILSFVSKVITAFGSLRRANRIADEVKNNIAFLEQDGWGKVFNIVKKLQNEKCIKTERNACDFIMKNFKGFGPKQSRNLWQSLGLTQYEIPIDSRVTKWLNNFGFPVRLTASGLSDKEYFNFISDGLQQLCKKCNIKPCLLDAVIFTSFDKDEWTGQNAIW